MRILALWVSLGVWSCGGAPGQDGAAPDPSDTEVGAGAGAVVDGPKADQAQAAPAGDDGEAGQDAQAPADGSGQGDAGDGDGAETPDDLPPPDQDPGTVTEDPPPPEVDPDPFGVADLPTFEEMTPGWNEVLPGGDTICARGGEYAFFVRKGSVDRLVVDFEGGGACWNEWTCAAAGSIFKDTVEEERRMMREGLQGIGGIYESEREDNPFRDWHHVFIPYCTGDVHIGDARQTYGPGRSEFAIEHRGAVNARTVLEWTFQNVLQPERVAVTGCSAGAYGSILWSPWIARAYPEAPLTQLGDSGAGIITDDFMWQSFPVWQAGKMVPDWVDGLDPSYVNILELSLSDFYERIATFHAQARFAQFNSLLDDVQVFYFQAMGGGEAEAWSAGMRQAMQDISAAADNFRYYLAPGAAHCVTPFDRFYAQTDDQPSPAQWLDQLVGDASPPDSVACAGCLD